MKSGRLTIWLLSLLSAVLLSLPWLVDGSGFLALVAFLPLLCADRLADTLKYRRFGLCQFCCFVLWNAATTFWVCNATVGGGIFAIVANAFQMSLVWEIFRFSKKRLGGALPYVFLAAMWIAWERRYFFVDISWPWLTLGNAFGRSTHLVQWYEFTGTLGGSLWIWLANLSLFLLLNSALAGLWKAWNKVARIGAVLFALLTLFLPPVASLLIWNGFSPRSEAKLKTLIVQPNFDPYEKFGSLSQSRQTDIFISQLESALDGRDPQEQLLILGPETFCQDVITNNIYQSPTLRTFRQSLYAHPGASLLVGAASWTTYSRRSAPSILARDLGGGNWGESHNSAVILDTSSTVGIYHKSKLVVGTELTPYPKIFVPLDNALSRLMGVNTLLARNVGQSERSLLYAAQGSAPLGCAICYESIYGEFCTEYVRKGARAMTVITNDAWWGDTPGYRQHLSYACLRAIELRRDIARCGNTGISCFIDQRGRIVSQTPWWERCTLEGELNLSSYQTFFVRHGDVVGRVCTLLFLLIAMLLVAGLFKGGRKES